MACSFPVFLSTDESMAEPTMTTRISLVLLRSEKRVIFFMVRLLLFLILKINHVLLILVNGCKSESPAAIANRWVSFLPVSVVDSSFLFLFWFTFLAAFSA
ncbi:OLC1v1013260C1 [Oldenlandia corymbosa var. corymbosa]|uniref:OLC1v1013260C1 n=1 Tax=Oldenlandia corymbosa var. corymbosa TaxID=529605 RepID=A0AAV1E1G8_OLDCO|nr:OLC1v1013260C1 [Oldenlandia corymbosa var. corymbosa]